jgi:CBS domain-containing protein
VYVHPKPNRTK